MNQGIHLAPVAADDHQANDQIENSNRTLRSFFNRLRVCDKRSTCDTLVAEALYSKNISLGSKACSAYELRYRRRPPLLTGLDQRLPTLPSIEENAIKIARRRLREMLRTPHHEPDDFAVCNLVAICRDGSGWLGDNSEPARVTRFTPHFIELIHNGLLNTIGRNKTRKILRDGDHVGQAMPGSAKDGSTGVQTLGNIFAAEDSSCSNTATNGEVGGPSDNPAPLEQGHETALQPSTF